MSYLGVQTAWQGPGNWQGKLHSTQPGSCSHVFHRTDLWNFFVGIRGDPEWIESLWMGAIDVGITLSKTLSVSHMEKCQSLIL